MPPNATATMVGYGVVVLPDLMDKMRDDVGAAEREEMRAAIDTLQENPYPSGCRVMPTGSAQIITCVVKTQRKASYLLAYTVDEQKEKVYVISVDEKRFNPRGD
jgi:hypothetical protein